jgi:hypothetical protein
MASTLGRSNPSGRFQRENCPHGLVNLLNTSTDRGNKLQRALATADEVKHLCRVLYLDDCFGRYKPNLSDKLTLAILMKAFTATLNAVHFGEDDRAVDHLGSYWLRALWSRFKVRTRRLVADRAIRALGIGRKKAYDHIRLEIKHVCWRRSIALLDIGAVSIAPDNAAPGDRVAVLLGHESAMVLRGTETDPFQVIGAAYVDGVM